MKKFAAGIAVAAMSAMGLVSVASPASAACDPSYNRCDDTKTQVEDVRKKTNGKGVTRVKVKVDVAPKKGAEGKGDAPRGTFLFSCTGPGDAVKNYGRKSKKNGKPRKVNFRFPVEGEWTCVVTFVPNRPKLDGSSSSSFTVTV
ncbi:hypothetical protein [Nocardioides sp. REDSEA-S30_B4]|jgi:hypothetical protein|uniref:hypothetical protein n=1 Tax=Nocardioides sp. REDSEA-S30_B4 TaxID=1811552 RepID=UPI000AC80A5E|nr:hypothetical protein [Nocardioides sp. REDSEA-S30_B4]